MDDLSARMRAATASPPPSRIDVAEIVATEQRRRARRPWAYAAAAAAVALVVIAVPMAITGDRPDRGVVLTPPDRPSPSPISSLCLSASAVGPRPPQQSPDLVQDRPAGDPAAVLPRLDTALNAALDAVLPAGTTVSSLLPDCPQPRFLHDPARLRYEAGARLQDAAGSAVLLVRVMPTADEPQACHGGDGPDCRRDTLPDGTVTLTDSQDRPGGGVQLSVVVHRPDDTSVVVVCSTATRPGRRASATRDGLPLTGPQLAAIGRAEGLSVYP